MSKTLGLLASLVLLGAAAEARAADGYIQNDTFTGSGNVDTSLIFLDQQGAGVIIQPSPDQYPVTLTGMDILVAPAFGGSSGPQGAYYVDVWYDPDGGVAFPPVATYGDVVNFQTIGLTADTSQFNRYVINPPFVFNSGRLFLAVREQLSTNDDGTTIAMDTGPQVPGANWFYGASTGWTTMDDGGYPAENWIIRAVIEVDGGSGTTTTATTTTGTSAGTTSTSTSGTTGSTSGTSSGTSGGTIGSSAGTGSTTTTGASGTTGTTATTASTGTSATSATNGPTSGSGGSTGTEAALRLDSVSPNEGFQADDETVTVLGAGFQFGVQVLVGPTLLNDVTLKSPATAQGTLPHGTAPGVYDVTVVNPDGSKATLQKAFTIQAGTNPSTKGGGCGCQDLGDGLLMLPLGMVALQGLRRRRR